MTGEMRLKMLFSQFDIKEESRSIIHFEYMLTSLSHFACGKGLFLMNDAGVSARGIEDNLYRLLNKNQPGIRQRDTGEEGLGLSRIGKEKCLANVMQVLRISSEDTPNLAIC